MPKSSGHAAVGLVVGQRCPDGSRPELVELTYRDGAELETVVIRRETNIQQVEDTASDSIRFIREDGREIRVPEVIDANPICDGEMDV